MILKKEIRDADILVWVSFGLMLLVKFCTIFLFVQISTETKADIEAVVTRYEANPLMELAGKLNNIGLVLGMIILPAGLMALYYLMRRKVLAGKTDIQTLSFFVQFAFFALLINICNDGAALLSKLAGG